MTHTIGLQDLSGLINETHASLETVDREHWWETNTVNVDAIGHVALLTAEQTLISIPQAHVRDQIASAFLVGAELGVRIERLRMAREEVTE